MKTISDKLTVLGTLALAILVGVLLSQGWMDDSVGQLIVGVILGGGAVGAVSLRTGPRDGSEGP